jgi:hypothetical protein
MEMRKRRIVKRTAAEAQRPTVTDLIGAILAVIEALVVVGFAFRTH